MYKMLHYLDIEAKCTVSGICGSAKLAVKILRITVKKATNYYFKKTSCYNVSLPLLRY